MMQQKEEAQGPGEEWQGAEGETEEGSQAELVLLDHAYRPEPPVHTYEDLFPALPVSAPSQAIANINDTMRLDSSILTKVFVVPSSERKQDHSDKFGEGESLRICQNIMKEMGAHIEISGSRDQSLTFVVTGKKSAVLDACRRIGTSFQTQTSKQISIPKEHHGMVLGKLGQRRNELEQQTATKILVPGIDDPSELITIIGTKKHIETAEHEILVLSDEQSRKAVERISVPKIYHPFIFGAYNENLTAMTSETGARINIPPPSVMKDEIVIAGEKEGVLAAKAKIDAIHKEMKRKCTIVSVEVPKSQHKYVIGTRGATIQEILKETGVSVEMPPADSAIGTINLRGPHEKLGLALSKVCEKANSQTATYVPAPAWIYKYIIGKKGAKIKQLTQDFPKVHLEFPDGEDKIKIEGPPEEVDKAQVELLSIVKNLQDTITFAEINIDMKHLKYIVGKAGANVNRLKEEHGVNINIGDNIRIEGSHEGVAAVKKELVEKITKMENEKERDVIIDHRYFRSLIGTKGENIKEIKAKFDNQVQILVPGHGEKRDIVKLRGPHEDVDRCHKYLLEVVKELTEASHVREVPIFKQFHKFVIGKGGANIRKIRDETQTKIDLPAEGDTSEAITITGKRENVEEAIRRIRKINEELANVVTEEVAIDPKFYNSLIGTGGKLIHAIMEECGGVSIKFPPTDSDSDRVVIRGPADEVARARQQLLELASERQYYSFSCEVRANPKHHKFLIGKNGANIKKLRDQTGARIVFPSEQDGDREAITVIGSKEAVEDARVKLEASIRDIDKIVEGETEVDPKHHRHFVARRGEVLNRISEECGGVQISFPRHGVASDRVVLKGPKDCIAVAIQRIADVVNDLDSQVTVECVIPQKHHRSVMGAKGFKVQAITAEHDVQIKFPDRFASGRSGQLPNGSAEVNGYPPEAERDPSKPDPADIIRIHGRLENCNSAKQALLNQVPISIDIAKPQFSHRFIVGSRGQDTRNFMESYDVHIICAPSDQEMDVIRITGAPANVEEAKKVIEERSLKVCEERLEVDPDHHPKVIGAKGAVITKIRGGRNVQITIPKKGDPEENIFIIQGFQDDVLAARNDIVKVVDGLNSQIKEEVIIDPRVFSRLIGSGGRNIRKFMSEYRVDIRLPRNGATNPDLVTIIGTDANNVDDAKNQLQHMQEEYLQDIRDAEERDSYRSSSNVVQIMADDEPSSPLEKGGDSKGKSRKRGDGEGESAGFVVPGAPWEQRAPDTASTQDFPAFGLAEGTGAAAASAWGPRR